MQSSKKIPILLSLVLTCRSFYLSQGQCFHNHTYKNYSNRHHVGIFLSSSSSPSSSLAFISSSPRRITRIATATEAGETFGIAHNIGRNRDKRNHRNSLLQIHNSKQRDENNLFDDHASGGSSCASSSSSSSTSRDEDKIDKARNTFQEEDDDNMNIELLPLTSGEELSDEILAQLQEGQPSEFAIMKELLGINAFTYLLAGLIVIFLSLNTLLGPGWLGQFMGVEGTGTFTQVSDSLPGTVDLNAPENLL